MTYCRNNAKRSKKSVAVKKAETCPEAPKEFCDVPQRTVVPEGKTYLAVLRPRIEYVVHAIEPCELVDIVTEPKKARIVQIEIRRTNGQLSQPLTGDKAVMPIELVEGLLEHLSRMNPTNLYVDEGGLVSLRFADEVSQVCAIFKSVERLKPPVDVSAGPEAAAEGAQP